jgi:hypothetical protein
MSVSSRFNLQDDTVMVSEDVMQGPFWAENVDECALMCDRQNSVLGGFRNEGAIGTGYSFQHCNGFTYDKQTQMCQLKNKAMGNFQQQLAPQTPSCAFYTPSSDRVRYVSGYRWNSLINEVNDTYPNMAGGVIEWPVNAAWSEDNWGSQGNFCTQGTLPPLSGGPLFPLCAENEIGPEKIKKVQYDVRPGAILSPKNTTTGPYSFKGNDRQGPITAVVDNMQQCADFCSHMSPQANAWTFYPNYTTQNTEKGTWNGLCLIGNVRVPYYQTLTEHDNGAISGYALTSLSTENHRFLFG